MHYFLTLTFTFHFYEIVITYNKNTHWHSQRTHIQGNYHIHMLTCCCLFSGWCLMLTQLQLAYLTLCCLKAQAVFTFVHLLLTRLIHGLVTFSCGSYLWLAGNCLLDLMYVFSAYLIIVTIVHCHSKPKLFSFVSLCHLIAHSRAMHVHISTLLFIAGVPWFTACWAPYCCVLYFYVLN